jgi:hypothetical protein
VVTPAFFVYYYGMSSPKTYMAASVPRSIRQSRLGYVPLQCILGSRYVKGGDGSNLVYDIVMLPAPEFQRMRMNVGLQNVITPGPKIGPNFQPVYVLADAKHVTVPADEPDPENYAKDYFKKIFGLTDTEVSA